MSLTHGDWLRDAREGQRLSLRTAATLSGLSAGYIHKLEQNRQTRPKPETLRVLADAYQRSFDEALAAYGMMPHACHDGLDPDLIRLKSLLDAMPEQRRRRVISAVEMLVASGA